MAEYNFVLSQPVRIEFGEGKAERIQDLANKYGFTKGILICDKLFVNNGYAQKIIDITDSLVDIYSDITPNPLLSEVKKACALIKEAKADYVVAMGGGSSMDLAKFACAMVNEDGNILDYFYNRKSFTKKPIPLIVIPTTAGTGSEVTSVSVCTNDENGDKVANAREVFFAHTALVDPNLTHSLPPFVTATTGLDAMAHAFEAYWCKAHNPISDGLAIAALKKIFANLLTAYKDGKNAKAREEMSLGSLIAGLAFAPTRTAGVHACSYPLSMYMHLCHGEACAFTLDSFIRINGNADKDRMMYLAHELGFNCFNCMADKVYEMKKEMGMKLTLKDVGIDDVPFMAEKCANEPLLNNNPIKLNKEQLEDMFNKLK